MLFSMVGVSREPALNNYRVIAMCDARVSAGRVISSIQRQVDSESDLPYYCPIMSLSVESASWYWNRAGHGYHSERT